MSKPLLQVKGVSKIYTSGFLLNKKKFQAVQDINFNLYPREIVAIVGESGSGKSTIARMLTNLTTPTSGEIRYEDRVIAKDRSLRKQLPKKIQMIFQDPFGALNPNHTIGYLIGRPLIIHRKATGDKVRGKVLELLSRVGLTPAEDFIDKYPFQLSGGQKQRVIIARVLGLDPQVIIADEPTSMLDVSIGIDIMNLLLDLKNDKNLSFIFITHNLASARYMADRILVMYGGQIMEMGVTDDVIQSPNHPYTKLLLSSSPNPWKTENESADGLLESKEMSPADTGCRFHSRCPYATDDCRKSAIPLNENSNGRLVRCNLF